MSSGDDWIDLEELIRRRAYEISQEPGAGSPEENWARAERELRASNFEDLQDAIDDARAVESTTLLSAEIQAFGHP